MICFRIRLGLSKLTNQQIGPKHRASPADFSFQTARHTSLDELITVFLSRYGCWKARNLLCSGGMASLSRIEFGRRIQSWQLRKQQLVSNPYKFKPRAVKHSAKLLQVLLCCILILLHLGNETVSSILKRSSAKTAWGTFAGITIASPSWRSCSFPSIVILPVPSKAKTKASPSDLWELISPPFSARLRHYTANQKQCLIHLICLFV